MFKLGKDSEQTATSSAHFFFCRKVFKTLPVVSTCIDLKRDRDRSLLKLPKDGNTCNAVNLNKAWWFVMKLVMKQFWHNRFWVCVFRSWSSLGDWARSMRVAAVLSKNDCHKCSKHLKNICWLYHMDCYSILCGVFITSEDFLKCF